MAQQIEKIECHITCRACHKEHVLMLDYEAYVQWKSGTHVQVAFPQLTADQRELLISKLCGSCFDKLVPEEAR